MTEIYGLSFPVAFRIRQILLVAAAARLPTTLILREGNGDNFETAGCMINKREPSISVAIAVYNGELFLEEQLNSLQQQSHPPNEVVVTDDCSTDRTPAIIDQFQKSAYFRVIYARNDIRLGWKANFLRAVGLCRSELIALCDQDDIWLPEKLATCLPHFSDCNVTAVHHRLQLIDERGIGTGNAYEFGAFPSEAPPLSLNVLWHNPLGLSLIFRKELSLFDQFWDKSKDKYLLGEPAAHDQWYFGLAGLFGKTAFERSALVKYRQHSNNVVGLSANSKVPFTSLLGDERYIAELSSGVRVLQSWIEVLNAGMTHLPNFAQRAELAKRALAQQAEFRNQQIDIFTNEKRLSKLQGFWHLASHGGYSSKSTGLGKRALIRAMRQCLF